MKRRFNSLSKRLLRTLPFLFLVACETEDFSDKTHVTGVCKSCVPYYVRGSWHYPQKHYEYDEEGLASWYGPGFHGKPTAAGERYNQHDKTAAHKTLPLPTVVRVTNLKTDHYTDVVVNDRGPFVYEGRIIDLSLSIAKKVGIHARGTGRVRVQALVNQSKALSNYISENGTGGRTWSQVYEDEVAHIEDAPADKSCPSRKEDGNDEKLLSSLKKEPLKKSDNPRKLMEKTFFKDHRAPTSVLSFPKPAAVLKNEEIEKILDAASATPIKNVKSSPPAYIKTMEPLKTTLRKPQSAASKSKTPRPKIGKRKELKKQRNTQKEKRLKNSTVETKKVLKKKSMSIQQKFNKNLLKRKSS